MTLSSLRSAKCSGLSEGERWYGVRFGQIAAYVYTEDGYARTQYIGQVLLYRGVLSLESMIYSTQQIGI